MTAVSLHSTSVPSRWVRPLRAAWLLLAATTLVLFANGVVQTLSAPLPDCAVPSAACAPGIVSQQDARLLEQMGVPPLLWRLALNGLTWLGRLGFAAVAAIIFWRRSDDWVALLMAFSLLPVLLEGGFPNMGALAPLVTGIYQLSYGFYVLPFIFPNGRYVPGWTRWVAWPLALLTAAGYAAGPAFAASPAGEVVSNITGVGVLLGTAAMIYRYWRVSNAAERQQTKWVVIAFLGILPTGLAFGVLGPTILDPQASVERLAAILIWVVVYSGIYVVFSTCLGIAMLRYRLWDADLIIRRTLIYGALTGLLALVYLGAVLVLQAVLTAVTGQSRSELVTVLSTLAIAALFVPLRSRLQAGIDRAFYRRKYDAARTLAGFASGARNETDLEQLSTRLIGVVEETMQPASVSLWLRPAPWPSDRRERN